MKTNVRTHYRRTKRKVSVIRRHKRRTYGTAYVSDDKIAELGKKRWMSPDERKQFVNFINTRFPEEADPGYIDEWADRWSDKRANAYGDKQIREALRKAGYKGDRNFGSVCKRPARDLLKMQRILDEEEPTNYNQKAFNEVTDKLRHELAREQLAKEKGFRQTFGALPPLKFPKMGRTTTSEAFARKLERYKASTLRRVMLQQQKLLNKQQRQIKRQQEKAQR